MSHWETFRSFLLPSFASVVPEITEAFNKFVAGDRLPDFYDFQETELNEMLVRASGLSVSSKLGLDSEIQHKIHSNYRTALEEFYAVAYFERFGCRVIRPSLGLVQQLMETEVNWKLKDIRAPCPHMYIALPPGHGIKAPSYKKKGEYVELDGFYISWTRVTEATKRAENDAKEFKILNGLTVYPKTEAMSEKLLQMSDYDVTSKDVFGDWACRAVGVMRDGYSSHDWSIQFFNMHWGEDSEELAEGALEHAVSIWHKSSASLNLEYVVDSVYVKMFHLAANIFLYMSHPGKDDVVWSPNELRERLRIRKDKLSSKQRRSLKRRILEGQCAEEWIVGQKVVVDRSIELVDNAEGMSTGLRTAPRAHWVRGFWRGQWIGSEKDGTKKQVPKWIQPYGRGIGVKPKTVEYKLLGGAHVQ